jgi:hypothetical protein
MFRNWRRRGGSEYPSKRENLVPLVSDAAVATELIGDGRLIPVVVLDTTSRPDLVNLFKAHSDMPPGDALSTWIGLHETRDHLALWFQFKKPFETEAILNFELTGRGITVDLAMHARAIYLQAGKPGDRFYKTMESPRILVEIGAEMPTGKWEELWQRAVRRRLRKEGVGRHEARNLAPQYIKRLRDSMAGFRMKPSGTYVWKEET